jgi:hypothetical protein
MLEGMNYPQGKPFEQKHIIFFPSGLTETCNLGGVPTKLPKGIGIIHEIFIVAVFNLVRALMTQFVPNRQKYWPIVFIFQHNCYLQEFI